MAGELSDSKEHMTTSNACYEYAIRGISNVNRWNTSLIIIAIGASESLLLPATSQTSDLIWLGSEGVKFLQLYNGTNVCLTLKNLNGRGQRVNKI